MAPSAYWRKEGAVVKAQSLEPLGLPSSFAAYRLGDLWQVTASSQPGRVNGR